MATENWRQPLDAAALALRLGREGEAGIAFAKLIDALMPVMSSGAVSFERVQPLLGAMFAAQSRGDAHCLADLLEYELAPLLPDA